MTPKKHRKRKKHRKGDQGSLGLDYFFEGRGAVPGTSPLHTLGSASQQEPCNMNVPSGLVPATLLWTVFLGILSGRDQGGTWYGTYAKPERHFTKGMFGKDKILTEGISVISDVKILISFGP